MKWEDHGRIMGGSCDDLGRTMEKSCNHMTLYGKKIIFLSFC
jgi:hypothetical protein